MKLTRQQNLCSSRLILDRPKDFHRGDCISCALLRKTHDFFITRVFPNSVANLKKAFQQLARANDGGFPCKRDEDGVDYLLR
jgi:hypothetical protein